MGHAQFRLRQHQRKEEIVDKMLSCYRSFFFRRPGKLAQEKKSFIGSSFRLGKT